MPKNSIEKGWEKMNNKLKGLLLSTAFGVVAVSTYSGPKQESKESVLADGTKITVPTGIHTGVILDQFDDRYMDITALAKKTCETIHTGSTSSAQSCTVNVRDARNELKENRGVVKADCDTSLLGKKSCTIKTAYKPA